MSATSFEFSPISKAKKRRRVTLDEAILLMLTLTLALMRTFTSQSNLQQAPIVIHTADNYDRAPAESDLFSCDMQQMPGPQSTPTFRAQGPKCVDKKRRRGTR